MHWCSYPQPAISDALKVPWIIPGRWLRAEAHPECINLDYEWRPHVDICCDITRGIPLPDNYVRGVFTEHCLEHIGFGATQFVLNEFLRVVQPGHLVRIIVPDFAIYVDAWLNRKQMPYADKDRVDGFYSPMMSINRIFRAHGHQFMFDFATLQAMLQRSGFVDITQQSVSSGGDPNLLLDTLARAVELLYVEARKPSL